MPRGAPCSQGSCDLVGDAPSAQLQNVLSSLIHSFSVCFLSTYYVPGAVLWQWRGQTRSALWTLDLTKETETNRQIYYQLGCRVRESGQTRGQEVRDGGGGHCFGEMGCLGEAVLRETRRKRSRNQGFQLGGPQAERSLGPATPSAGGPRQDPEGPKENAQHDWQSGGGRHLSVSVGREGRQEARTAHSALCEGGVVATGLPQHFSSGPCQAAPSPLCWKLSRWGGASKSNWGSQVVRAFGIQFPR